MGIVGALKKLLNSQGVEILEMWTFDVDYVTQNNRSSSNVPTNAS